MRTYRGVIVVTHRDVLPLEDVICRLAEAARLDIEDAEIEELQVVILWRSLVDCDDE